MSACNVVLVIKYQYQFASITLALAARKNLIIDTDLFSGGGSSGGGGGSWNFAGSDPARAAHVVNAGAGWPPRVRVVFLGDDVGGRVAHRRAAHGCDDENNDDDNDDPCTGPGGRRGIRWRWRNYAIRGLGGEEDEEEGGDGLFEFGNAWGRNWVLDCRDGTNRWVWDEEVRNQFFLRLKVPDERAAEVVDDLFLRSAFGPEAAAGRGKVNEEREQKLGRETGACSSRGHDEGGL
ncbi:hypothetical protein MYCTH_2131203 [Thermothelomyces thermophilus ATCC 42464]|uniref:Uncharacterized protein n=1 Tax=Thermothelomyces thermophilus (strain ATCC 42464 / BCRC 31852 / DSM 1799) TaxID=573729 RepID=G2QNF1_THET4|nr:uncharacterized protein MYCTH_2131203 [Thermothelomyces thermophilus ATCC 42464]AEO62024.1 hypothetical protein MYCTH_2131203 [Thermothelomyces thermophilus ATCC 42464]